MGKCRYCGKPAGLLKWKHAICEEQRSIKDKKWIQGIEAFAEGEEHYFAKRDPEALKCFDKAIACGYTQDANVFSMRGNCLQVLAWDLDAIDDFSQAIALDPEDCNLYFMRAISKCAIGMAEEGIIDLKEAVRLSLNDSARNADYCMKAKEIGWRSHTARYEAEIQSQLTSLSGAIGRRLQEKKKERAFSRGRRH